MVFANNSIVPATTNERYQQKRKVKNMHCNLECNYPFLDISKTRSNLKEIYYYNIHRK